MLFCCEYVKINNLIKLFMGQTMHACTAEFVTKMQNMWPETVLLQTVGDKIIRKNFDDCS